MGFKLSIIIAVYSETTSVIETIKRLLKNDQEYIEEILLVVSPKSTQLCLDTCREASLNFNKVKFLIQKENPGQGLAFQEGFNAAQGTYISIMSGDLETEPEAIHRMVSKAKETGCDVVSASRWLKQGGFEGYGVFRTSFNYLFQHLFMFLFKTTVSDLTYGLKLYKTTMVREIQWECTGHEFCLESILKMIKLGASVKEVPTKWSKRKEGKSKNISAIVTLVRYLKIGLKVYFSPTSTWHKT